MNKADFISEVAKKAGLSKKDTTSAVEASIEVITERLAAGDSVAFIGFGAFSVSERAARDGVNPSTGAKIKIPSSNVAKFKVGAKLKEAVNKK